MKSTLFRTTATCLGRADITVFRPGNGQDYIEDFRQGEDGIDLSALTGRALHGRPLVTNFNRLDIRAEDVDSDGRLDSVITLAPGDIIIVMEVSSLWRGDFIFH